MHCLSLKPFYLSTVADLHLQFFTSSGACSTAHRSNRPDHWDGLMLDRSAVGQLSSLSSRTKWQRLPGGDTSRSVLPAGNRWHFVLLDKDESCPTADLSNIRPSQWSRLFDRWAVEHALDVHVRSQQHVAQPKDKKKQKQRAKNGRTTQPDVPASYNRVTNNAAMTDCILQTSKTDH